MFTKSRELLGQNSRSLQYIKWENFLASKKLADSKNKTKNFLQKHNVAVPETMQIIKNPSDISLEKISNYEPPFVVKPNNGYGGKGILIIDDKDTSGNFITNTGESLSPTVFQNHLHYILDGFFSLSGRRDSVIIEKKISLTKEIELLGTFGLPDIRVISYNMVPVMAMMRIPTQNSDGKANLHAGAAAVGIDIGTGKITYMFENGKHTKSISGLGDLRWIVIPDWEKVLSLAVQVQQVTGIGFLGSDIVLDEEKWPLLLEMNVRPGLEIQNVNRSPLKTRLKKVEGVDIASVEKWVRLGRDLFSGDVEHRIEKLSGKQIVGPREYLKMHYNDKVYTYIADIRTSEIQNMIDRSFLTDTLNIDIGEKTSIRIESEILWVKRPVRFMITDLPEENIILGRNVLRGFLIDPFKYKKWETPLLPNAEEKKWSNTAIIKTHESQLIALDTALMDIDKKIVILKHLTPTNLEEQQQIFVSKKWDYIPKFEYADITLDLDTLEHSLRKIEIPDIPWSTVYERKQKEIHNKILFLRAFKEQNTSDMMLYSSKLYGDIIPEYFETSTQRISQRDTITQEDEFLSIEDIREYIKKFNHIYNMKIKVQESSITARFVMRWDTLVVRNGAYVGKREMRSIVAHEIEWHYLRKLNGRKSSLKLFERGWANYIETDEGIAIYNQNRFLTPQDRKYYSIFERYFFVEYAKKHSYKRLIRKLIEFYDGDYERVFVYMLRLKRGFVDPSKSWVFMKDVVYVNGYMSIQDAIEQWVRMKDLYMGKLHLDDIALLWDTPLFTQHKQESSIPFSA